MSYVFYNPNPEGQFVGDCVVRAISKLFNYSWEKAYSEVVLQGYKMHDMPSSNKVWGEYLRSNGWTRHVLSTDCPSCFTVIDFCMEFPRGSFMLATGSHVIACINGNYYDTWDSGGESPIYYWRKEV